jgi:hypothetical protein
MEHNEHSTISLVLWQSPMTQSRQSIGTMSQRTCIVLWNTVFFVVAVLLLWASKDDAMCKLLIKQTKGFDNH